MGIKIQFETWNYLPKQKGIKEIKDLSYLVPSAGLFKYECSPDWAQGRNIPVEQIIIFSEGIFIAGKSARDTLGHFLEKCREKF